MLLYGQSGHFNNMQTKEYGDRLKINSNIVTSTGKLSITTMKTFSLIKKKMLIRIIIVMYISFQ